MKKNITSGPAVPELKVTLSFSGYFDKLNQTQMNCLVLGLHCLAQTTMFKGQDQNTLKICHFRFLKPIQHLFM